MAENDGRHRRELANEHLRQAQALHSEGRIDEALSEAARALDLQPDYVEALTYYGTTMTTRKLAYRVGLETLERALELAPDDAGVNYSLGWCYEFVAYRLERQGRDAYRDPLELYELAAERLQRCIDLNPEQGLKEDAQDLLDSILPRIE
jgi:tetratricopeptide (TPR) repeat protein